MDIFTTLEVFLFTFKALEDALIQSNLQYKSGMSSNSCITNKANYDMYQASSPQTFM